MYQAKYQLQVLDKETGKQIQRSDTHTWGELEPLWGEYWREYPSCEIRILHVIDVK